MSPLQYQKWLRLNEARRLMLTEKQDATTAAFQVGYESPSQFSREYGRLFGAPAAAGHHKFETDDYVGSGLIDCAKIVLKIIRAGIIIVIGVRGLAQS